MRTSDRSLADKREGESGGDRRTIMSKRLGTGRREQEKKKEQTSSTSKRVRKHWRTTNEQQRQHQHLGAITQTPSLQSFTHLLSTLAHSCMHAQKTTHSITHSLTSGGAMRKPC